ncbi:kinase-like protein [Atractiella rhizophila]|nr:kinase-like protein [Atractiella rhizophila]
MSKSLESSLAELPPRASTSRETMENMMPRGYNVSRRDGCSRPRHVSGNLGKSRPTIEVLPLTTTSRSRSGSINSASYTSRGAKQTFVCDAATAEDIISWQVEEPLSTTTLEELDGLLLSKSGYGGIGDYTFVPVRDGKRPDGLVGKGKFSEVRLAIKNGQKYAIKHTPLHPHHPLIATRLLREPDVLAELPQHPNLIRVFETIRTPGHFYLVEEYLNGYLTLEAFCARYPSNTIPTSIAYSVLFQLTHVVKNALHSPISVCHRDIKPENILIHPKSLRVVLLDFGLATHYSKSKKKLSTCCGSPAFHSPEIWAGLKSQGMNPYWGPEIDVWCIGLSLLRCMVGKRYPIGSAHTSLANMSHKVLSALIDVDDDILREILSNFLDMDGDARLSYFQRFQIPLDFEEKIQEEIDVLKTEERRFKTKSFLKSQLQFSLDLKLVSPISRDDRVLELELDPNVSMDGVSLSSSPSVSEGMRSPFLYSPTSPSSRRGKPLPLQILLKNRSGHPFDRVFSFIKYSLRCHGILYHVLPSRTSPEDKEDESTIYLACVAAMEEEEAMFRSSKATNALIMALMGPSDLTRPNAQRSSSSPPLASRTRTVSTTKPAAKRGEMKTIKFYMSITYSEFEREKKKSQSTSRPGTANSRRSRREGFVVIEVSDRRVLQILEQTLELQPVEKSGMEDGKEELEEEERGRKGRND